MYCRNLAPLQKLLDPKETPSQEGSGVGVGVFVAVGVGEGTTLIVN
jgi:hypothetical protein